MVTGAIKSLLQVFRGMLSSTVSLVLIIHINYLILLILNSIWLYDKSTPILVTILLCNLLTSMWYQYRMWSVPLTRFRCLLARVEAYYCCCSDDNNHCHYYSNDDIIHWDYICNNDRYKLQWQPTLLYIKLHCCSLNQTTVYYIVSMKWQSAIGTNLADIHCSAAN